MRIETGFMKRVVKTSVVLFMIFCLFRVYFFAIEIEDPSSVQNDWNHVNTHALKGNYRNTLIESQ